MAKTKEKKKRSLTRKISNVFIAAFAGLIMLVLLFIGISQTSTFRNFVKEKVTEIVNSSINGKLHIGSIEGTLLSTISIKDISVVDQNEETVFYSGKIETRISIPQLLTRTLYFKDVIVSEAQLNVLENEDGQLNIATLIKPSEEDTLDDTGDSSFPFLIQVNNLQLDDLRLVNKTFKYRNEKNIYKSINFDDLEIDSLNLSAKAIADLDNNNYSLIINNLSFAPNVEQFSLQRLSGIFVLQNNNAIVRNFKLISDNSNISLDAEIDSVDLFGDFSMENLQNSPAEIKLTTTPFSFADLESFFPETDLLKNKVTLTLEAKGTYGDLEVENLDLQSKSTKLVLSGTVKNLHDPDNLYFDADINNSEIDYNDILDLMPALELPEYKGLLLSDLNIHFVGSPTNFKATLNTETNQGELSANVAMNFDATPVAYNINFETKDLDLSPVIGNYSKINASGKVKGKGLTPSDFNSDLELSVSNSQLAQFNIADLKFDGTAKQKVIRLSLSTETNNARAAVLGEMDFTKQTSPFYNLNGNVTNLNLATVLQDTSYESDLNFKFGAIGKNFEIDSLEGRFNVLLDSSTYMDKEISQSNLALSITKDSTNNKVVSLTSDFVDFNINGQFSLENAIDVLAYQGDVLSTAIAKRIDEFNPLYNSDTAQVAVDIPEEIISKELSFDYSFTFKDFTLMAVLLDEEKLDISGSGEGTVLNTHDMFELSTDIDLDYFLKVNSGVMYVSNLTTGFKLSRNNSSSDFDNLFGSLTLNCERFYSDTDIKNIQADLIFNENQVYFNASANVDDEIKVNSSGNVTINAGEQDIKVDDLAIVYNGITFQNLRPLAMTLKVGESFDIEDFSLYNGNSAFHIYGILYNNGKQNVKLDFNNIDGNLISRLMGAREGDLFNAAMDVDGSVTGTFSSPLIDVKLAVDSVGYGESEFGSFLGKISYKDKNLNIDAAFADTTSKKKKPRLTLKGDVPIDLSFTGDNNGVISGKGIDLHLLSNDFNVAAFGNVIPAIKNQDGIFKADISLKGTLDDPEYSGSIKLTDTKFLLLANNLKYSTDAEISFNGDSFTIDNFTIKNADDVPDKGTMTITGNGVFDGFVLTNADIKLNGSLTVLDDKSQSVQPAMYGKLFIASNGDWEFKYTPDNSFFSGNVDIKDADVVVVSEQSTYATTNDFKYIILQDTTNQDTTKAAMESIVNRDKSNQVEQTEESELNFDYSVKVNIPLNAQLEIILSQLMNQKLMAELTGSLNYEKTGDNIRAQGAFDLMDGSKLEFIKTFDAEGKIRFESDITDPYLDIVATYQSDYLSTTSSSEVEEVAVKLKLSGPVSRLSTNLASNPDNLSVYVGARNIENDIPDERYDASDALSFIVANRFKDDLSAQNKQDIAQQSVALAAATSLLGPLATNFVNSAVGDAVNNIQIGQSGEYYKVAISGRLSSKVRYSIGSTTEYIDDLNKASLRLDYLITPKLIFRLERKNPIEQSFGVYDKITEGGIKYRFAF